MEKSRSPLIFLFITAALDTIGLGIVIPTLPDILKRFVPMAEVSEYFGYFIAVYSLMQFLASPLFGAISDRYGRRPVLFLTLLTSAMDYVLMAYAPNLIWLFLGRMISGFTGASLTVCMASVADISEEKNRATNFGIMGAAFGLGFILGPALGGILGQWGPEYPFLAAASLSLMNFIFGLLVLPETLQSDKRNTEAVQWLNPIRSLKKNLIHPVVRKFAIIHFLLQLAGMVHPAVWTLYSQHRFGWGPKEVGLSLTLVGVLMAFSQGRLTKWVVAKWGEEKTLRWGVLGQALAYLAYGLAPDAQWMVATIFFGSIFSVVFPALQALASREIPSNIQGEFQGTLVSLSALASMLAPLVMTRVFAAFSDAHGFYLPGAPYIISALLGVLTGILVWRKK